MPNQPQATMARRIAGMLAPRVPKEARAKTGKEIPYFVPACALSTIGNQHDQVSEKNGEDGLPPIHAAADQARRQHVSGDANAHPDPERGDVPGGPGPLGRRDRREVGVVKVALFQFRQIGWIVIVAERLTGNGWCRTGWRAGKDKGHGISNVILSEVEGSSEVTCRLSNGIPRSARNDKNL